MSATTWYPAFAASSFSKVMRLLSFPKRVSSYITATVLNLIFRFFPGFLEALEHGFGEGFVMGGAAEEPFEPPARQSWGRRTRG